MADFRGYVTAAGQIFEALAKQMGYPVTIGFIEVGDGKLPDSESPIDRTQLVHKLKQFPAIVEQDAKNPGQWVATCYIPADDAINGAGYFIREIGCKLINQGNGVLYAYRRVSDDWKPVITSGEAKSFIYKLRFIPSNGELLTPTIDPSVVLVDKEELARVMTAHVESRNHPDASEELKGFSRHATQQEVNDNDPAPSSAQPVVTVDKLWGWAEQAAGKVPFVFSLWKRSLAEAGYDLIGQFGTANEIDGNKQALLSRDGTKAYIWQGELPKNINENSTPENTGGVNPGAWQQVDDETLRDEMSGAQGTKLLGFTNESPGSAKRTQYEKNIENVHIRDFAGKCDGVSNDATPLLNALATGRKVSIDGNPKIELAKNQVASFFAAINRVAPDNEINVILPDGEIQMPGQVEINSSSAININIIGPQTEMTSVSEVISVTGTEKDYRVKLRLSSAQSVSQGNYLYIGYVIGTGHCRVLEGVWKVISVSGEEVTIKHTLNMAWPNIQVSSARCISIKTVLRWPNGQRGIAIAGTTLRSMQNLVLAGSFDISSGVAADGYSDGLQIGSAADQPNSGSSESNQIHSGGVWCKNFGIVEWASNGLQVAGGKFILFQGAACSNGWRGFQAANNGAITAKYTAAIGNGASGYEAEAGGDVVCNGSIAAGNGNQGVYAIGNGFVSFAYGEAKLNKGSGIDSRNISGVIADGAKVVGNAGYGLTCTNANILFGSGAISEGNAIADTSCAESGTIDGLGAQSLGVIRPNAIAGCKVIMPDGRALIDTAVIINQSTLEFLKVDVTSVGDIKISVKAEDGASKSVLSIKKDGTLIPDVDAFIDVGRPSNRFKTGYFSNGTQSTSDATLKTPVRKFNDAEISAAMQMSKEVGIWEWLDSRGDRLHVGMTVQRAIEIMEENGLNPFDYSFICHDEWIGEYDDSGSLSLSAGSLYSFRDNELNRFIMRGLSARLDRLE